MELLCQGVGIATTDSEMKVIGNGTVATVSLAFNRSYKDKDGAWQKEASYIKVQIFGARAEKFAKYVKKGVPVYVNGYIKQDNWLNAEQEKRSVLVLNINSFEIVQKTIAENTESSDVKSNDVPQKPKSVKTAKAVVNLKTVSVPVEATNDEEIPF